MANSAGVKLDVKSPDMHELYSALKAAPGKLQVDLRRGIKAAAAPVVQRIKAQSAWSGRIPHSIQAKPSFAAKSAGVTIIANRKIAPEAAPLENGGQSGNFRHPVFGHMDRWAQEAAHPFFYSAVHEPEAEAAISKVMDDFARQIGFH